MSTHAPSIRRLTHGPTNHVLTNTGVWSPGGDWIYYDVRSGTGTTFDGNRIERVNVVTGDVEVVYQSSHGANVGVVTTSPIDDRVVFIRGPQHPTPDWSYAFWHRRGVIVDIDVEHASRFASPLEAADYRPPFTPGALRGGTHVHVFSPNASLVSFTYDDHVLATTSDPAAAKNQRNIGVAKLGIPVVVPSHHPRNEDGTAYSVLVTRTVDSPVPGSDEINRAYEDAWVGDDQIAFIGDTISPSSDTVAELFIVRIPDDWTTGAYGPIEGTSTARPSPPAGCHQRRLTFTTDRRFPGLAKVRHWPRCRPDGSEIYCLINDDAGRVQLWSIDPTGFGLRQISRAPCSIRSSFTVRRDGNAIACVMGDDVCEIDTTTGSIKILADANELRHFGIRPRGEAVVYSPDGSQIAIVGESIQGNQPNHLYSIRVQETAVG